jgi:hypothetical protein
VGSADALVSLWDVEDLACLRTFSRLQFPIRTVSFTHDSKMIASASEDLSIDVVRRPFFLCLNGASSMSSFLLVYRLLHALPGL